MKIEPISDLLRARNLRYPSLLALTPSEALYTALLVQPQAHIQVRDDFIRNADRVEAQKVFKAIVQLALEKSVELLLTPEYSFPWESIDQLCSQGLSPSAGRLWVLGCESLSLADLPGC